MSSWLLRSHKIYIPNWLQLPNSFAHTHCEAQVAVASSGFSYACSRQHAGIYLQQCHNTFTYTYAKLVLVFSRAVDLLHIEWFLESPPRAHINDTVNHMKSRREKHTRTHNGTPTPTDAQAMHDGITEIHTRHLLGNQSARGTKRFV